MSARTPNYQLMQPVTVRHGKGPNPDTLLEAGSFVRPIEKDYLPKHIAEKFAKEWMNPEYVFVYTYFGIIPVHKDYVRQT